MGHNVICSYLYTLVQYNKIKVTDFLVPGFVGNSYLTAPARTLRIWLIVNTPCHALSLLFKKTKPFWIIAVVVLVFSWYGMVSP